MLKKILFPVLASITLAGCEKVIDVDLKAADKRLVIEAVLTDKPDSSYVKISETADFFGKNTFPEITNALVTITNEGSGKADTLSHSYDGVYLKPGLKGEYGSVYILKVIHAGNVYSAVSRLNQNIKIDSLIITAANSGHMGFDRDSGFYLTCRFMDDPAAENYYRLNIDAKREQAQGFHGSKRFYHLLNDRYENGKQIDYFLFDQTFEKGDLVKVEMLSMDRAAYTYFSMLQNAIGSQDGLSSVSPANPQSNIKGGALGYFAAYSVSEKTVLIK